MSVVQGQELAEYHANALRDCSRVETRSRAFLGKLDAELAALCYFPVTKHEKFKARGMSDNIGKETDGLACRLRRS